jgi:hypothetical protein
VRVRVPVLDVTFSTEAGEERLRAVAVEINGEVGWGGLREYAHVFVANVQADNMLPEAEYPVLLAMDRRRLYGYEANVLECFVQRSTRDGVTSLDYLGLRVLPLVLKVDGELLKHLLRTLESYRQYSLHNHHDGGGGGGVPFAWEAGAHRPEEAETAAIAGAGAAAGAAMAGAVASASAAAVAAAASVEAEMPRLDITGEALRKWYVERLEIFPLEVTFCVGDNELGWPVIQDETAVELLPLGRSHLYETNEELLRSVVKYYGRQARQEVYKIIGSLDAIGSPLGAIAKVTKGLRDIVIVPWSSLVLDDTPGAFFVGVSSGLWSLLYNVTDAGLTTLLRVINVVSWLTLQLTFDDEYQQAKRRMRRAHPPNVWWGIAQGSRELARGLWTGVTGLLTQPWRGARLRGSLGCLTGVAKGLAGLPLKPLGGAFDFLGKTIEGLLRSMGTGYTTQRRLREPHSTLLELSYAQVLSIQAWLDEALRERYVSHSFVKIKTRRGRFRDRLLLLSSGSFHVINVTSMSGGYHPKTIPLNLISGAPPNTHAHDKRHTYRLFGWLVAHMAPGW